MTKNDIIIKRDRRTEEDRMTKKTEGDLLCKHDSIMIENRL